MSVTFASAPFIFARWYCAILINFTFLNAVDFIPFATLVGGIAAICFRRSVLNTAPQMTRRNSLAKYALLVLSQWPLIPLIPLVFLALEAQNILGSWPTPVIDRPRAMGGKTVYYDFWFQAVKYSEAMAGALMVLFFLLLVTEWEYLPRKHRFGTIGISLLSCAVFVLDPGRLYEWWLD